jgi:uncharacterized protein YqjF (DUF2071 family)
MSNGGRFDPISRFGMNPLKTHPFAVEARFDRVVAVSFGFPEEALRSLVPAGLELDTYGGLGFVTVALVWTRHLRPAGLPQFLGRDFFLAGYRIFTRLPTESGRRLRGLRILRSETDRRSMVWSGNLFTHYNYRHVTVRFGEEGPISSVDILRDDGSRSLHLRYDAQTPGAGICAGSPFPDWHTARLFAGPMPFTFSERDDGSFVVIRGTRDEWSPRPVSVHGFEVALFDEMPLRGIRPVLANAFAVENIDYRWERGQILRPAEGRAA